MSGKAGVIVAVTVCVMLAVGTGLGRAAGGGSLPMRDHGRGHWFHRACSIPAAAVAQCDAQVVTDAGGTPLASPTPPAGAYGPAQFHTGYSLPTVSAAATPPTIAIVDAYDDPNAEADLGTFDSTYGLPACTTANGCFKKVNQSGGTSYPATDSGWALEISLDVQTAHAICQNCRILLVEANVELDGRPRRRRERSGRARRERDLQLLGRGRVLGRDLGRQHLLQPSGNPDHRFLRRQRLRGRVSGRLQVRHRRRRHDAEPQLRQHLRERERLGTRRLGLLDLRAQAVLADGHRLLAPHGRRRRGRRRPEHRCGGLRLRAGLRSVRLVPGRRHEPRRTAARRRLRPRGQHRLDQERVGTVRACRYGLVARRHDGQQRQLQRYVSLHRRRRLRRAHRRRQPERDGSILTDGRRRLGRVGRVSRLGDGGLEWEHAHVHVHGRRRRAQLGRDLRDRARGLVGAFHDRQRTGLHHLHLWDGRGVGFDDPAHGGHRGRRGHLYRHLWLEGELRPGGHGSVLCGHGRLRHRREVDRRRHPHRPGRLAEREREHGRRRLGRDGRVSRLGDGGLERQHARRSPIRRPRVG